MANPKQSKITENRRRAFAPYNFVPLPEAALEAPQTPADAGQVDAYGLPHADRYHANLHSGRIDCTLVTRSLLYTRRAVATAFYNEWADKMDKLADNPAAMREYAEFFHLDKTEEPVIPGSSLRGMLRNLMEIVAHSHLRWVGKEPTFTYRAVAAQRDDPLRDPYQETMGRFGRNVRAGILERDGEKWKVRISPTPQERGIAGRHGSYLKIKEEFIPSGAITSFRRFEEAGYKPGWFLVRFSTKKVKQGEVVDQIADLDKSSHPYIGLLVCSGNMLETANDGQSTPRRSHAIVLAPLRNSPLLTIDDQAIDDYLAGQSDYVRTELTDWGSPETGCLREGAPVFFVDPKSHGETAIRYFGHTPNFRIPAQLQREQRAATPVDFIPDRLRNGTVPDLVEAIFGWVAEGSKDKTGKSGLKGQRAGRVFVSDAKFQRADDGLWLDKDPIWLQILSTPKPTTFQHYLVQDQTLGHDPNRLPTLAHYGSAPETTQIRGYKQYWTKGESPSIRASAKELQHKSQLTQVRPVKAGVHFAFTIRFENLSDVELGGLLWALTLPGDPEQQYCHRLGMGKPLGMGAVVITPSLALDDRFTRYQSLFSGTQWSLPDHQVDATRYIDAFETHILQGLQSSQSHLREVPRIQTLLTLLQWREGTRNWQNETRYMEIERESKSKSEQNEYKNRPVLPTPEEVAERYDGKRYQPQPKPNDNRTAVDSPATLTPVIEATKAIENLDFRTGTVVTFGLGRNESFGYIQYTDKNGRQAQIMVHQNQVDKRIERLSFGDKVRFTIGTGPNGPQAENVTRL